MRATSNGKIYGEKAKKIKPQSTKKSLGLFRPEIQALQASESISNEKVQERSAFESGSEEEKLPVSDEIEVASKKDESTVVDEIEKAIVEVT